MRRLVDRRVAREARRAPMAERGMRPRRLESQRRAQADSRWRGLGSPRATEPSKPSATRARRSGAKRRRRTRTHAQCMESGAHGGVGRGGLRRMPGACSVSQSQAKPAPGRLRAPLHVSRRRAKSRRSFPAGGSPQRNPGSGRPLLESLNPIGIRRSDAVFWPSFAVRPCSRGPQDPLVLACRARAR